MGNLENYPHELGFHHGSLLRGLLGEFEATSRRSTAVGFRV